MIDCVHGRASSLFHSETFIEFTGQEIDNLNNTPRWSIVLMIPRLIQLMDCIENRERHLSKLSTRSRAIWSDAFWVLLQSEKKINSGKNWAVITSIANSLLNWENKIMQPLVSIQLCLLTVLTLSQISREVINAINWFKCIKRNAWRGWSNNFDLKIKAAKKQRLTLRQKIVS